MVGKGIYRLTHSPFHKCHQLVTLLWIKQLFSNYTLNFMCI